MKLKNLLLVCVATPLLALPVFAQDAAPAAGPVPVPEKVMKKLKVSGDSPIMPMDVGVNQATVVMDVTIGTDGKVENIDIKSGPDSVRGAAADAVKTWKYKPYMVNGAPAEVKTTVSVYMTKDTM